VTRCTLVRAAATNTSARDVLSVTGQTKIATEVFLYFLEGEMAVIPEASVYLTDKDADGFQHVRHRYCDEEGPCTSFDCYGHTGKKCEKFDRLPTGVKTCSKYWPPLPFSS